MIIMSVVAGLCIVLGTGAVVAAEALGVLSPRILSRLPITRGLADATNTAAKTDRGTTAEVSTDNPSTNTTEPTAITAAEALLQDGHSDEAVVTMYDFIRSNLIEQNNLMPGLTHWELLTWIQNSDEDEMSKPLTAITTAYERAAYAPETIGPTEASEAIEAAQRVISETDQFL
jgi:hypothetical protein